MDCTHDVTYGWIKVIDRDLCKEKPDFDLLMFTRPIKKKLILNFYVIAQISVNYLNIRFEKKKTNQNRIYQLKNYFSKNSFCHQYP